VAHSAARRSPLLAGAQVTSASPLSATLCTAALRALPPPPFYRPTGPATVMGCSPTPRPPPRPPGARHNAHPGGRSTWPAWSRT
jgi:hypothetical protein